MTIWLTRTEAKGNDRHNDCTVQDPASFVLLLVSLATFCEVIPWQYPDTDTYLPVTSVTPPAAYPLQSSEKNNWL
jgi:hypothetical protein